MHKTPPILAASLLVALTCSLNAVAADQVRIVSVSPPNTKPLQAGDDISFEIALEYRIEDADHRRVRIEILRGGAGERSEVLSRWFQVLPKTRGALMVQRVVRVPRTASLSVRAVIEDAAFYRGPGRPISSDKKDYGVADRDGQRIRPRAAGADSIRVTSVAPASEPLLRTGDNVDFEVNADYELRSANTGRILWFLASAGRVTTILATSPVSPGRGSLSLKKTIQMGAGLGTGIQMFVFLMGGDYIRNLAADARGYRVEQPPGNANAASQITVSVESEQLDRVRIVSVSPTPDRRLHSGATIEFNLTVEYEVATADLAELSIRLGGSSVTLAQDDRVVTKGYGAVTVTRRILLPPGSERDFNVSAGLSPPSTAYDRRPLSEYPSRATGLTFRLTADCHFEPIQLLFH